MGDAKSTVVKACRKAIKDGNVHSLFKVAHFHFSALSFALSNTARPLTQIIKFGNAGP